MSNKSLRNIKKKWKKIRKIITIRRMLYSFLIFYLAVFCFNQIKPLHKNISYQSETYYLEENNVEFLYDLTYKNKKGEIIHEQEIFENIFNTIKNADKYILLDMFLYNSDLGKANNSYLPLSSMLTKHLIEKKKSDPKIKIDLISDEINTVYNGFKSKQFEEMKNVGINLQLTNLNSLRDTNPIYSSIYRIFFIWFGNIENGKLMPHPFNTNETVSIRSYLKLLNFKANHRKVIIADNNDNTYTILITSANPHDGSSAHSNVGIKINGSFAKEIYNAEIPASNNKLSDTSFTKENKINTTKNMLELTLITESKIRINILNEIEKLGEGDFINLAMFYLSDRKIINSIKKASKRGVGVNIILDPNKDAFGYEKNGIPNRQVAHELVKNSDNKIKLKWYNTNGEQFHTKLIHIKKKDGTSIVILGSANYTKRNLADYNLEMNVKVKGNNSSDFFIEVENYFNRIFNNNDGNKYTLAYEKYKEPSIFKYWLYRFQEFTGLSTF